MMFEKLMERQKKLLIMKHTLRDYEMRLIKSTIQGIGLGPTSTSI
jgi:hypothetical protein